MSKLGRPLEAIIGTRGNWQRIDFAAGASMRAAGGDLVITCPGVDELGIPLPAKIQAIGYHHATEGPRLHEWPRPRPITFNKRTRELRIRGVRVAPFIADD